MDKAMDAMTNFLQTQTTADGTPMAKTRAEAEHKAARFVMQDLIDNTPDLNACPQEHAIMICGATGKWSRLAKAYPKLANDPLKAFEMLNNTQYTAMREYYNHRRITDGIEEANAVWE